MKKKYTVYIYRDAQKQWRWKLKANNGRIVACSGEGFHRLHYCKRSWTNINMDILQLGRLVEMEIHDHLH